MSGAAITSNEQLWEQVTEAQLLQGLIDYARALGYLVYHTRDSRGSRAGFPDLVIAGASRLWLVECKTERGHLSRAQQEWVEALILAAKVGLGGPIVWVVKPSNVSQLQDQLAIGRGGREGGADESK